MSAYCVDQREFTHSFMHVVVCDMCRCFPCACGGRCTEAATTTTTTEVTIYGCTVHGMNPCTCSTRIVSPYRFTPHTEMPRLSDDDIDRIARRVAEIIKESK